MAQAMTLPPDECNPTDRLCLRVLREGRATAAYIADVGGYSTGNVRSRLRQLNSHDHVAQIYSGLYQLVDDPFAGEEIDVGEGVEERLAADRVEGARATEPMPRGEEPRVEAAESAETAPADTEDRRDSSGGADVTTGDLLARYREFLEDRRPQKAYGKDAVVDALEFLREEGPVQTAELRAVLWESVSEHYADEKSAMDSYKRYFQELPGFEKPGYGEWGYTSDDEVLAAIEGADGEGDP